MLYIKHNVFLQHNLNIFGIKERFRFYYEEIFSALFFSRKIIIYYDLLLKYKNCLL